jgi:hypothetical protein
MWNFLFRATRALRRALSAIGIATGLLGILVLLLFGLFVVGSGLAPFAPAFMASGDDWLRTLLALGATGTVSVSYPLLAETFAEDKTCKSFKRGRVRSLSRNGVMFVFPFWPVLPLGPICVYIVGLLMIYSTAVISEPKASWKTVLLDWGVKHWLNQACVSMMVSLMIHKSWTSAGVTILAYFAWCNIILVGNFQRQKWRLKKVVRRALVRQLRTDRVFAFVWRCLRK